MREKKMGGGFWKAKTGKQKILVLNRTDRDERVRTDWEEKRFGFFKEIGDISGLHRYRGVSRYDGSRHSRASVLCLL